MNIKKYLGIMACLPLIAAGNLYANVLTLVDTSGVVGGTVDVKVYWDDQNTPSDTVDFQMLFNESEFSFSSCAEFDTNGDWTFFGCSQTSGAGTVNVAVGQFPNGPILGSGGDNAMHLFTLTFDVVTTEPNAYMMIINPDYFDAADGDGVVTTDGEGTTRVDATVSVLGPAYDSIGVLPNGTIDFGTETSGQPDIGATFNIDNIGQAGTSLDGNCSIIGTDAGAYALNSGGTFAVPEAGPNQVVDLECLAATTAPGMYNDATLQCTHNGDTSGAASPVNYPLLCTIVDRPRPTYTSSNPGIGGSFEFGDLLTTDPAAMLTMTITNTGNDMMDGLDGACSILTNPNGAYNIDNLMNYGPLAIGDDATRTVTCDTNIVGDHTGGVMRCTALDPASNEGNFDYPLNCTVASIPTYASDPMAGGSINLDAVQGNGPGPVMNLEISNAGDPLSVLDGSCSLGAGDTEITFSGATTFSVAEGSASNIPLQCEGDVGNYSRAVVCTADAPASNAGTFNYTANCNVDQPDPAMYSSVPADGGTIDLNEGNPPPPVNNGISLTTDLVITNAASAGDDDLVLDDCEYTGDPEITASPVLLNTTLAPGDSTTVDFTCATDTTDVTTTFTGTYTCPYDPQPTGPVDGVVGGMPEASYPVECEVREQYSEVVEDPASGTPQTAELMPNEPTTFSFTFTEIQDEMLDAEIDCSLATGTDFAITMNGPGTATVPAADSIQVDVTFTDPGQGETFNDTLNCAINDNPPPGGIEGAPDVSWPITVTVIGRNAEFSVTKDFNDDNPLGVEVALDCNTGLPLFQTGTVHDPDAPGLGVGDFTELKFIIVDFEPGELDCEVYETTVPFGYLADYDGDVDDGTGNAGQTDDACTFDEIFSAGFTCEITNTLQEVDLIVNKEWIDDNPGFNLPEWVEIEVQCDNVFNDPRGDSVEGRLCRNEGGSSVCFNEYIDPSNPASFGILPDWDGSTVCSVTETLESGAEGDVSDCTGVSLAPGQGAECTIVNTRLYEGIPTLSQYGLILMALMMLGFGLVGFRRYS